MACSYDFEVNKLRHPETILAKKRYTSIVACAKPHHPQACFEETEIATR